MNQSKSSVAIAALTLSAVFSTAAIADTVTLASCTKDGKTITLTRDISGGIKGGPTLAALAQAALDVAAHSQTGDELAESGSTYMEALEEGVKKAEGDRGSAARTADFAYRDAPVPPVIGKAGSCPAPKAP